MNRTEALKDKLARLSANVRTGGKGSVRRKHKAHHKSQGTDEKQFQNSLKKLGVNQIPGIEEVNLFMEDDTVIHFSAPLKVQAAIQANTYVVSGRSEVKKLSEMLPSILGQLNPSHLATLKRMAEAHAGGAPAPSSSTTAAADDDMPELVPT
eukprot:gnl/Spiro4/6266_TR3227_c0_g1_i1.p1 gnl/Spiro4/6266_TR3227_c0_g1~~gnl/Spiro4/6266_TR3227_c0_g1_i1.p1  ORF type:complete len:172 (-),score=47.76 gnl/Spiro4/6266_TR3227_c0_g1_i1:91-546(-)